MTVAIGDIFNPEAVASVAAGHDVLISAFAPSHEQPEMLVEATRGLMAGAKKAGVDRLLMVGGAASKLLLVSSLSIRLNFRMHTSPLHWPIVRRWT